MNGMKNQKPLIWGIVLIFIGLLFLLERWLDIKIVWRMIIDWWPLILIFIGALKIYRYFAVRQS